MITPLQRATQALLNAERVAIFAHISPDGDTLGCILALTHALRALGKEAIPFAADGVPEILKGMPGAEWVERNTERRDFDLAVVCDAGALNRIGTSLLPVAESAPLMIDIDHHVVLGATFGDIQLLDAKAAATAEIIWRVLRAMERATNEILLTREVAECLLTGIITDTGSFMFLNVRPQTLRIASELQKRGAIPAHICEQVFTNRSFASQKLLARALASLQCTEDGKIAWEHVTGRDFEELGATDEDSEGIVNHARDIRGVYIGLMFREIPGRKIRVNLRGREGVAVNEIAAVFGGGGHNLAAGCSVEPPLEEAERRVVEEAIRHLNAKGL